MRNLKPFLLFIFSLSAIFSHAQLDLGKGNLVKYNLSGLAVKHHVLQYERVLSPKHSFALSLGFSPSTSLPFKDRLIELYGDDAQARTAIESTSFNKFTITPEYRFYFSGKAPQGFYLAPFLRYTRMKMSQEYTFVDSDNTTHKPLISGNFSGFGGGLLIGSQWTLGSSVVLDLWLAGPFIGSQKASFHGLDDKKILNTAGLKSDIESTDIPLWKMEATVVNQTISGVERGVVDVKLTGPFVGVRMLGFTLGIRF
jgi:hypothetical protein